MEKYKLSKTYQVDTFCGEIKTDKGIFYLLKDENGKTLKELALTHYTILKYLMDYQVIQDLNKGLYKK